MIQKLLYKGHKRKVHKGTRGGHYVIYNKKKVYLKPISVKKKTKKKTTKKKTTKGKTKSSIRMPRMSNFKKLFGKNKKVKKGGSVVKFRSKAVRSAEISKNTSANVFDIISRRYMTSGWSRLELR